MKLIHIAAVAALTVASASTFAAKPRSIVFDANKETTDGTAYASYVVKCSDGSDRPLTAWDNRKRWCVGDASSELCEKKQIKAAKKACKTN